MELVMQGIVVALIVSCVGLILDFFSFGDQSGKGISASAGAASVSLIVLSLINACILYWGMPTEAGWVFGYSWVLIDLLVAAVIFAWFAEEARLSNVVIGGLFVAGFAWILIGMWAPLSDPAAKELASIMEVEKAPAAEFPDTDPGHVVLVNEQIAAFKASQFMAAGPQYKGRNLESVLQPGQPVLQQVNKHLYWIIDLQFAGMLTAGQIDNIVPGYIVVDAEDPDAKPQLRDGYEMRYVPGGYWAENLSRYVYRNGYQERFIDDLTIEVDDDWKPYYTASINLPLHPKSNNGRRPLAVLVVDPQTGKIAEYKPGKEPDWIDRVYSGKTVAKLLGHYARWKFANRNPLFEQKGNRFEVSGEPGLVYNNAGEAVWEVLLTSKNADTSASRVILVNAKTGKAVEYSTRSGITIESNVVDVMRSTTLNIKNHEPINPQLYSIYGRLTWVASYVPNDESSASSTFAGVALMPADAADAVSVAYSPSSFAEALRNYRGILARGNNNTDPNAQGNQKTVEGVIAEVSSAVINGNETFYIKLNGNPRIFMGRVGDENIDLAFAAPGKRVRIRYLDVGSKQVDIGAYEEVEEKAAA